MSADVHGKGWHDGDPAGPRGCLGVLVGCALLGGFWGMVWTLCWLWGMG